MTAISQKTEQHLVSALKNREAADEVKSVLEVANVLSSAEAGYIDGVTAGTAAASKAVVLDANKAISTITTATITNLTSTAGTITTLGSTTGTITNGTVTNLTSTAADIGTATVDIIATDAEAAEHGAGAIGTAVAPVTTRYIQNGAIITEIKVDLTGLDSSGTENDVIGLAAGGAAYIGRYVVATCGIVYRVEMSCIEIPLTGDADVILVAGSAADEEFDDTVADTAAICDGTGDWTLGETIVNNAPAALTPNYYLYLTQGATDDNTYTAGQFIIRLYGHPVLS